MNVFLRGWRQRLAVLAYVAVAIVAVVALAIAGTPGR